MAWERGYDIILQRKKILENHKIHTIDGDIRETIVAFFAGRSSTFDARLTANANTPVNTCMYLKRAPAMGILSLILLITWAQKLPLNIPMALLVQRAFISPYRTHRLLTLSRAL